MTTTSANPDDLDRFVTDAQARRTTLNDQLNGLRSLQTTVRSGCVYRTVEGTAVSRATGQMGALSTNERFVSTIHDELLTADVNADGVATVSNADVAARLTTEGVGAPPPQILMEPSTLMGEPPTSGFVDDPICAANGNFLQVDEDLAFPGWAAVLDLRRSYNSLGADTMGAFGPGWTSTLDIRVDHVPSGVARVRLGDGAVVPFVEGPEGSERLVSVGARSLELTVLDEGWILHEGRTKAWRFDARGRFTGGTAGPATLVVRRENEHIVELREERSGRHVRFEWLGMRVVTATASDGRRVTYRYDDHGALVGVDRPAGEIAYELDGNLITSVTDADGVTLARNVYDDGRRVIEQTNELGRTTRYEYSALGTTLVSDTVNGPRNAFTHDRNGNMTAMIDGHGRAARIDYDDQHRPVSITDRDGARRRYRYDSRGNLVHRMDPDGLFAMWEWDDEDRLIAEVHRNRTVTTYTYEGEHRRPSKVVEPGGGTYLIELADTDLPLAVTDPDGITTSFEWDDDGQMTAAVDGLGNRREFTFDPIGMPVRAVDGSGVVTEMENDPAGRLLATVIGPSRTEFAYTAAGRPLSGIDAEGVSWTAEHGDHGRLSRFTDGEGSTVGFDWDLFGNLQSVVAPDGSRYDHRYDVTGTLVGASDPAGNESVIEVDPEGRPLKLTDAAGREWSRTVDILGRTTEIVAPDGTRTGFRYHHDGQIARVQHPDGTTVSSEIDDLGRIVAIVDEGGARFEFGYSPAGRLVERRYPSGRVEHFAHDPAGRLVLSNVQGTDATTRLTLDGSGRVTTAQGPDGTVEYGYDRAGDLIRIADPDGTLSLERDRAGRVSALIDGEGRASLFELDRRGQAVGISDPAGLHTAISFDERGRRATSQSPTGDLTTFGFDVTGFLEQISTATGTLQRILDPTGQMVAQETSDGTLIERTLDPMGRVTSVRSDGADLASYRYDARGRLIGARNAESGAETSIAWDSAGRLSSVDGPSGSQRVRRDLDGLLAGWTTSDGHEVSIERDPAGRVTGLHDDEAGRVEPPSRPSARRDRAGRVLAVNGGATYRYDDAGRLAEVLRTDGERWAFRYGEDGLLESETGPRGTTRYTRGFLGRVEVMIDADGVETHFFYDASGRRIGANRSDGTTTEYTWDRSGDLASIETRSSGGDHRRVDVSHDAFGRPHLVDGVAVGWDDALSARPISIGTDRYLQLGGRARPTTSDGDWFAPPADPWGAETDSSVHIGMHGHLAAAGLVWMGARVYDPASREFLSPDPLPAIASRNGSASVYTYGWLDPVNFVDPSGLRPISQEEFDAIRTAEEQGRLGQAWQAITDDPWGTLAAVGVVAIGAGLMFVPGGQVVGAGILIGAATSAGMGIATGNFSPRDVALGGALGAIPGGSTLRSAVLVGAGTGAGGDLASQLAHGQPIDWGRVALSGAAGGLGGGATHGVATRLRGADAAVESPGPPTTAAASSPPPGALAGAVPDPSLPTGPQLPVELTRGHNATTGVHVYHGVDAGNPVYAGITNDMGRRQSEHGSRFVLDQLTPEAGLTRGQARAVEEALLTRAGGTASEGGVFQNVRHSISPRHSYHQDAVDWGEHWLQGQGI